MSTVRSQVACATCNWGLNRMRPPISLLSGRVDAHWCRQTTAILTHACIYVPLGCFYRNEYTRRTGCCGLPSHVSIPRESEYHDGQKRLLLTQSTCELLRGLAMCARSPIRIHTLIGRQSMVERPGATVRLFGWMSDHEQ